jgi:Protein of unknown function DUF262/HNH endonuclease
MKIDLKQIKIRDVVNGYKDSAEEGVVGYGGLLNIRPKYQREFVYKDVQRNAVIETVMKNFPLNVMYWVKNEDGTYEVLDGQQRTVSICEFAANNFSVDFKYFHTLQADEQEKFLNYELMIYICEGEDSEKLEWFKTINIAGETLTDQELRNAVYTGTWLTDAKKYFSKTGCPAYQIASDYMSGVAIRQKYLETTISWINNGEIEDYMSKNQHNPNANDLWLYLQNVINWTKVVFPKYRKEMSGLTWGIFYNEYKDKSFDSKKIEEEITMLMQDEDITKKSGIYEYILTRNDKFLNIRSFTDGQKRELYEKQKSICANKDCPQKDKAFNINEMEADHVTPWSKGGKRSLDNCQMLCMECNRRKSGR